MESRKVLSSLCYFSIFFAGFIFPLVVFFASGDQDTKRNAKKALFSHLVPIIPLPLLVFAIIYDAGVRPDQVPFFTISGIILMVLVSMVVVIWNIVKGIKVLNEK
ncbi:MAG: DUF4870 domain-containing protein [Bacillota bacterium]|nr:DUF4870 domain-containing protein [Bacillota bacterium]